MQYTSEGTCRVLADRERYRAVDVNGNGTGIYLRNERPMEKDDHLVEYRMQHRRLGKIDTILLKWLPFDCTW